METKKLLFFDIDGTLLDEEKNTIPRSTIDAINTAKEKGHKIFINTGRPRVAIEPNIIELNADGYICGCGTYVEFENEVLFHNQLTNNQCKDIVSIVNSLNYEAIYEGRYALYFSESKTHPLLDICYEKFTSLHMPVFRDDRDDIIFDKFVILHPKDTNITKVEKLIPGFDFIDRASDFKEIVPTGHSKATGIQFIVDYFNHDLNDCYVFGDSNNDRPMLEYVKHSVVMGNASDDLKKDAYFVTKHIDDDGIYHALKELQLI